MRIGFAFNQKPTDEETGEPEEPPSREAGPEGTAHDRFAEWDDAATIAAVESALRTAGEVIRLEADETFPERLRAARPDIVFNIAEGLDGPNREAHVPAICEFLGIPHTASDPLTLSLALDKRRAKEVFLARGVPTPAWAVAGRDDPIADLLGDAGPWLVKPLYEGSSKGIPERAYCTTIDAVRGRVSEIESAYGQPALIEEFLPGREFTVGILGNGRSAFALPIVEIRFDALPAGALPVYGYEAKWVWDRADQPLAMFECPARMDASLSEAVGQVALAAYHALGCRDWGRIDVRLDATGAPQVIEVNPLPGILPDPRQNSCLPKAARAAGIEYDDLILAVLDLALERYGMQR